jgi:DNA ligase (NAD+)
MTKTQLEKEILKHNKLYWDKNKPEISDEEYDVLVEKLKELDPDSSVLMKMGPSKTFGESVTHYRPMLSLDKKYDVDGIKKWYRTFQGPALVSPKMDGLAVSIHYDKKGYLRLAATRGDGSKGENITDNVRTISDIPNKISKGPLEIRGEIYMKLQDFSKYKDNYSNPRNLAAGVVRLKNPKKCAAVNLSFAAYDCIAGWFSEEEKLLSIRALGIPTIEFSSVKLNDIEAVCNDWLERKDDLDYEIDGIVFKVDDCYEQDKLGATSHHPRYAMAYKFQGDTGKSILRNIEWSVSRTSTITPVAIIDPINLSGAEITRVSLHNVSIFKDLGIYVGAEVVVTRRGGVIPHIEYVKEPKYGLEDIPNKCPSCGACTLYSFDTLMCGNNFMECRDVVVGTIEHFCKVVDIQGFGKKIIEKLYNYGYVSSPEDLYVLGVKELTQLPKVGPKLAKKLVNEVENHSVMPLSTFLRSLGISELGKHVSKILEEKYVTLDAVMKAEGSELSDIPTIGEKIALSVVDGLYCYQQHIKNLCKHIIISHPDKEKKEQASDRLQNLSFLFTGKLLSFTRKDAQKMVKDQGGDTPSSITKSLNFLVVGNGSKVISSKQKKAIKFNKKGSHIQIINESKFLEMIGG